MSYTKTAWVDDTAPFINASNLNHLEQGVYDAHAMAGGGAAVFVAAVNATAEEIARADYTCDGVADNVQIQAAIDAQTASGYGGKVVLSSGQFKIAAAVTLPDTYGFHLQGQGREVTQVAAASALNANILQVTGDHAVISDLTVDGSKSTQASGNGVFITGAKTTLRDLNITNAKNAAVSVSGNSASPSYAHRFNHLYILGSGGYGIVMTDYAYDSHFFDVWVGQAGLDGIYTDSGTLIMTQCHVWGCTGEGVYLHSGTHSQIIGSYLETNGQSSGRGIRLGSGADKAQIVGNFIWKNASGGVYAFQADRCVFTGNEVVDNGGDAHAPGVELDTSNYWTVTGNNFHNTTDQALPTNKQGRPLVESNGSDYTIYVGNIGLAAQHFTGKETVTGVNSVVELNAGQHGPKVINVLDYGALADNSTDNSAAFQSAVDALGTLGGVLLLPPGTYRGSISITANKQIRISGYGAKLLPLASHAAITVSQSAGDTIYSTSIEGLLIDGAISSSSTTGVLVTNTDRVRLRDMNIYGCSVGIDADAGSTGQVEGLHVESTFVRWCTTGIRFKTSASNRSFANAYMVDVGIQVPSGGSGVGVEIQSGAIMYRSFVKALAIYLLNSSIGVLVKGDMRDSEWFVGAESFDTGTGLYGISLSASAVNTELWNLAADFTGTFADWVNNPGSLKIIWRSSTGDVSLGSLTSRALRALWNTETNARVEVGLESGQGAILFGDGSVSPDVSLHRNTAAVLESSKQFYAVGGLTTKTKAGTPSDADTDLDQDGTLIVDTTNHKLYARSGAAWKGIPLAFPHLFPGLRTGCWYTSPQVGGQGITALLAVEATCYFVPFYVPTATAMTAIGAVLTVNGGAAEVIRLGIYNDDGFGAPSTVLLDAGTVSVSAGATVMKTIAINQTLAPGLYWLAVVAQGASGTPPTLAAVDFPAPAPIDIVSTTSLTSPVGYTLAGVTGALATTSYAALTKATAKLCAAVLKVA